MFLNSLNEQEYAEFVRSKPADQSIEKYMKSGLASELLEGDVEKEKASYQANELVLLEQARLQEKEDQLNNITVNELELKLQFQVFYDPTFKEFIDIVGREHDDELPLFAQLYVLK